MKIATLILFGFLAALSGRAQTTTSFSFDHLALSVSDVNRSSNFYITVLNLQEITNRSKLEGIRWFALGEGKELHLISIVKESVATNKAIHLALKTPDFDMFIRRLDEMKITYTDWPGNINKINTRADGIRQVFFQDPDGYWIEVNSVVQGK